ncbi:sensor histidine kinase NtrY-like [Insolitispirillum peregrinum]|uniref:sensor histidine kinase NtrY-like n=1 Tax=Insolitispirillum peregrinum TaxID=80876 RepID=UPI0036235A94
MRRLMLRMGVWFRNGTFGRKLAVFLSVAALISGIATYAVMTGWAPTDPESNALIILLNLDLVLLLCLGAMVAQRLVGLWLRHRSKSAGSRLQLRFVGLFSAIAVAPAILVAVFSALFFNIGVQSWFGERVSTALNESQAVAQAYLKEHQRVIAGEVLAVAGDVQRGWARLMLDQQVLERYLASQANIRGLTEAVIFDAGGKVVARAGYTYSLQFEEVPYWALERANNGEVAVLTGESDDRVRALVKLDVVPDYYLYVGRFVEQQVIQSMERTDRAVEEYRRLQTGRSSLELTFSLIFIVVALMVLMAAVGLGLSVATRLAQPISDLIDAAERIRNGELTVRVPEIAASDEIAVLSRTFNRMTSQLAAQQARLLTTNRALDERRRFAETVLAGVSAGIISTDPQGRITLSNRSASLLLRQELDYLLGEPLDDVVPELATLLAVEPRRADHQLQQEIVIQRDGQALTFLVRVTAENLDGELIGHVLTFDDITALQSAQRQAAWADVARRIAHEIKNPLTPIQLSAERLKRRYLKQITDDPEVFTQCTDTIVRHVVHIGQMVDEFSSFARMPTPTMKPENLVTLVRQAVFLQKTAYPAFRFEVNLPSTPLVVSCDAQQVGQALTNLLKNAIEAIEGADPAVVAQRGGGCIALSMDTTAGDDGAYRVIIEDNGKGLPEDRSRLTEPYVTTRAKGTGLGLAIVKKIMEDHHGTLSLEDSPHGGARVVMAFPHRDADAQSSC